MTTWPYPKVIAHRGGGILAPENTLAGMALARARGFRGVEFDVMLARDAVPVLMHDPMLGRTVAGRGRVDAHSAAELQAMDAGSWFAPGFAAEPVPSLTQVATFCQDASLWMNVEIKPAPGTDARTGAVVARLLQQLFGSEESAAAVPLLSSFSLVALHAAREAAPTLPRGWLVDRVPPDWEAQCSALGAVSLHLNHRHLQPGTVEQVRRAGYGLFCYTVNDPARAAELFSWGVDGFCTDRLDLIGADFMSVRSASRSV